jgi:hypothetical protein
MAWVADVQRISPSFTCVCIHQTTGRKCEVSMQRDRQFSPQSSFNSLQEKKQKYTKRAVDENDFYLFSRMFVYRTPLERLPRLFTVSVGAHPHPRLADPIFPVKFYCIVCLQTWLSNLSIISGTCCFCECENATGQGTTRRIFKTAGAAYIAYIWRTGIQVYTDTDDFLVISILSHFI